MEKLITFLNIIAWVIGVFSTLYSVLIIYWGITYPGSLEEIFDKLTGVKRTFNPTNSLIIALICWAFIITFW